MRHTLPKFNSSPLKIGRAPKGNDRLPSTIFQGRNVKLRGGIYISTLQLRFSLGIKVLGQQIWIQRSKAPGIGSLKVCNWLIPSFLKGVYFEVKSQLLVTNTLILYLKRKQIHSLTDIYISSFHIFYKELKPNSSVVLLLFHLNFVTF